MYSTQLSKAIKCTSSHLHQYIVLQSKLFCTNNNNNNNNNEEDEDPKKKESNWIEAPTLPCFLSQFDAMETFNIWARRQWFAPKAFKKDTEKYVHVIQKYYVPYWHFEASTQSKYHASLTPDCEPTKEAITSCSYSSSQPEMQIIASDKLTMDESKFLSVPLGPTQFQRMTHFVDDVLPDTVSEETATNRVKSWLQYTETQRVNDLVAMERLHKPVIASQVQHSCRKAYMPCFIIHFNPNIANSKDKPDAITDHIPPEASYRCIVNGYNGDIQGPKLYALVPCTKMTLPIAMMAILPVGTFMYYPFEQLCALSVTIGLSISALMQSPIFSVRVYRLDGQTLDTQQTRLKHQQMEEKEVEDILREAEKSWGSATHRTRPIAREQQRSSRESYEKFEQHTPYYSEKVKGPMYDSEGRPIGRRAIRYIELYETLGISPNASSREIQQAFTKLAKQYHPDQLQHASDKEREIGQNKFQKILLAFQVLKDPERRKRYDTTGSSQPERKKSNDKDKGSK